jgi:hypothetical protein
MMLPRRLLAFTVVLFSSIAGAAPQATGPAVPAACADGPLAPLAGWVAGTGKEETLPAYLLGLAGEPLAVRQKAYFNTTTRLTRVVDVNIDDDRCELVFVFDDEGTVTTWITNATGALERTYFLSRGEAVRNENEIVPNEQYAGQFDELKRFFLDKMAEPEAPPEATRSPLSRAFHRLFGLP